MIANDPRTWTGNTSNQLTPPLWGSSSLGQVIPGVTGGPSAAPANSGNDPRLWTQPAQVPSPSGGKNPAFPYYTPPPEPKSGGNGKDLEPYSYTMRNYKTPLEVSQMQQDWIEKYVKGQATTLTPPATSPAIPATPDPNSPPGATPVLPVAPTPSVSPTTSPTTPDPNAESGTASPTSNPYQQFYVNSLLSTMPEDLGGQVGPDGEYYIPNPEVPGGWVKVNPNTSAA